MLSHDFWGFEIAVCVSKILGNLLPVISTILEHPPLLPMLKRHRWLRLRTLAVAKLNLPLWQAVMCDAEETCSVKTALDPGSSFTASPRNTTGPFGRPECIVQVGFFEMAQVHERYEMHGVDSFLYVLDHVSFVSYFGFLPSWQIKKMCSMPCRLPPSLPEFA